MEKIVGIGEYAISDNENDKIKTFALGSCVAVTVFSPLRKVAGMVHIALPYSVFPDDDKLKPCYYATSAVPFLVNKICSEYNCSKTDLKINIIGGAESLRKDDMFKIGQRNIAVVRQKLKELNLVYDDSVTGGTYSRTLEMEVSAGKVRIESQPMII
ncbi:MAG: chemotaxis protein CheD [Acetivibrionales bacterium]|jgi:chemotaxis protein CheD